MNNVKHIRQILGLSQADLGKAIGVSQGNVSFYELGQEVPPKVARKLIDVAKAKGVDISFDDIYAPLSEVAA